MNTGVTAALIGGFALSNLQGTVEDEWLAVIAYLLSFASVHACTCACLTSAMLYRHANMLGEEEAAAWANCHKLMISMPWYKFAMGCSSYIISVIVMSLTALEATDVARWLALVIGIMSVSTVLMTMASITKCKEDPPPAKA